MKLLYIGNLNIVHTRRWVQHFAESGHQVHLIGEHRTTRKSPEGVTFYNLPEGLDIPKVRYLIWSLQTRRIVRVVQPDLLHAISVASSGWLGGLSGFHPLVTTAIGSDLHLLENKPIDHRLLSRLALRQSDALICVSDGLTRKALELGVPKEKLYTVYMSVNTRIFTARGEPQSARARFGLGSGPLVASIRSIQPIYNPLAIARAIPLVLDQIPAAHFAIATYNSDPELLKEFQEFLDQNGAAEAVTFIPPMNSDEEIADFYRAADVAVSVAASDGTPASVLETAACGTALVLGDIPPIQDWFSDEQEALLVPPTDSNAIAAAVLRLLADNTLRNRLRQSARSLVTERADSRLMNERLSGIYHSITGKTIGQTDRKGKI